MGKGSSAPDIPNYSQDQAASRRASNTANKAAIDAGKRADEQFQYFKDRAAADDRVISGINAGLTQTADQNRSFAKSLQDRYVDVFQPLEDDLIQEYQDYTTPGRYDLNRGRAMTTVGDTFSAARENAQRELESYGINPASTRHAALDIGIRAQEAAAKAAAANEADQASENTARALRAQALEYGLHLPQLADQAYGTSIAAGNAAAGNTLDASRVAAATQGTAAQHGAVGANFLNAANSSNRTSADIASTAYRNDLERHKTEESSSSGLGGALGLAAGIGSKVFLGSNPATAPFAFAAEDGGAIPTPRAVPEHASPSGGDAPDDVNARLTAGEFVVPEDVTRWFGEKHFQNMIQKARTEKEGAGAKPKAAPAIPGPVAYQSPGAIPARAA